MSLPRAFDDVVCLGCGCTCDDIGLVIDNERIVEIREACALGRSWFGDGRVPTRALRAGVEAARDEVLTAIARALRAARDPLVYLAPDITCEAQREGVALADLLRATLDSVTSATGLASLLAGQTRGRATASLGEVRNRADLVVFWGVDPSLRYPRFETRYAPMPAGVHVPDGRRSRTVVAVDVGDARGPSDADLRLTVAPEHEVSLLVTLAAALGTTAATPAGVTVAGGTAATAVDLAARLRGARYAVIVAEVDSPGSAPEDRRRAEGLTLLSLAVNDVTRGALVPLRGGGNQPGADAVATWQTGFPLAIDFTRGYPRYEPWSGTALARLSARPFDVALVLGAVAAMPATVLSLLSGVTTCAIGPRASESALSGGAAVIDTGLPSVHEAGTVVRMDDVPLPVRSRISGPPSTQTITRALRERIVAMQE